MTFFRTVTAACVIVALFLSPTSTSAISFIGKVTVRPSPSQLAWEAREIGVMIGWGLQAACVDKSWDNASAQECTGVAGDGYLPTLEAVEAWAPAVDVDQWLDIAASFGARYAVLVADHTSGFLLWPSKTTNLTLPGYTATKVDLVGSFATAAAARNIAPGYFYSVHQNWILGMANFEMGYPRAYGGPTLTAAEYEAIAIVQLQELLAYPTQEIWFDAGVSAKFTPHVGEAVAAAAPDVVCHSCWDFDQRGDGNASGKGVGVRWMGNELGNMPLPNWGAIDASYLPYGGGNAEGDIYAPASCDIVLSKHFWFNSRQTAYEANIQSTCTLVNNYLTTVGRGCNMILNLAPDWLGAVSPKAVDAYAALGKAITCLSSVPLAHAENLTLFDAQAAQPLSNGIAVWLLPEPVAGAPCAGSNVCFKLSLRMSEVMATTGQRIGEWAVAGCFVAGGTCADNEWVSLTSVPLPTEAATAIGARRFIELEAHVPAPAMLSALQFTVKTAYEWGGEGGGAPGAAPLMLSSVGLYDWENVSACVPGCQFAPW
jgi:alpha-L-fucosidase